ncbi:MAG: twin-arginine translocase subunit TatC [Phocaeicola sp.]
MSKENSQDMMTFGGHLEVLRRMLFRIIAVAGTLAIVIFCFKDVTWKLLLAPSEYTFATYRWIEYVASLVGFDFHFEPFSVDLIATDLSSQFMTHITTALYLGLLGASPYIVYELFRFVSPALYENEKKYSVQMVMIVYLLFLFGVLMSYYVLFPISFRFLGTYSVAAKIHSTITLDSYISTFTTLTLLMGVVFQLPVIAFVLTKLGMISSGMLSAYRKHSFIIIMFVAAVITPPDLMTLLLVTVPLYLLYEVSIIVARKVEKFRGNRDFGR